MKAAKYLCLQCNDSLRRDRGFSVNGIMDGLIAGICSKCQNNDGLTCFRCQRRLPTSSFWKDNKKKSGYRSTCKECLKTNQIDREIIAQNKSMKNDDFFGSIPKGLLIPAKNPPKICKKCKKRKIANRFKEGSDVCLVCKPEPKQENILRQLIEKFDTFTTVSIEKSGRVIIKPHSPKLKRVITTIDSISSVL